MDFSIFDLPLMVVIAGPNGAGKSTFYGAYLEQTGLPFVNADVIAAQYRLEPYAAADAADVVRRQYVANSTSFIFETVFSDPAGEKLGFMVETAKSGFTVVLCFIGVDGPDVSQQRVAMRVAQGGHDVPDEKLQSRYERTMNNFGNACRALPHVLVFDNNDLARPYRLIAQLKTGRLVHLEPDPPGWFSSQFPEDTLPEDTPR